ncbi:MAG TPA: hypothetical protein VF534_27270 [Paraburkholderia sp.]
MALESYLYGNPERVLEAKQARETREKRRAEDRIIVDPSQYWSPARKAAEALFPDLQRTSWD